MLELIIPCDATSRGCVEADRLGGHVDGYISGLSFVSELSLLSQQNQHKHCQSYIALIGSSLDFVKVSARTIATVVNNGGSRALQLCAYYMLSATRPNNNGRV